MGKVIFGVFLILHGLVHLLYIGHSQRMFALKPGLAWPDGSWALGQLAGSEAGRMGASALLALAALGFAAAGIGLLAGQNFWRSALLASAGLSTILYLLFWNGQLRDLDGQGGIAILINLAVVALGLAAF